MTTAKGLGLGLALSLGAAQRAPANDFAIPLEVPEQNLFGLGVGAGVMYSRLVGDAADSPIVSEQGSKNQWVYGAGALYAW